MRKTRKLFIIALALISGCLSGDLTRWTLTLSIPDTLPEGTGVYLAGNFNNWNPGDPNFRMIRKRPGKYTFETELPRQEAEFKFTLGNWDRVETRANGMSRPNRKETLRQRVLNRHYVVKAWAEPGDAGKTAPRIAGNMEIIEAFPIPQLDRTRRIWIWLPPGYESDSASYPVLYLHDGQNCFSTETAFGDEWHVDETLFRMMERNKMGKIIVVAVDNGEDRRMNEYAPFPFHYAGREIEAEGALYGSFIAETLKPYIDEHYRTQPGRLNTGIMGSSMGGLISLYIGLEHQQIFSKVGALSSSFGLNNKELIAFIKEKGKEHPMRIWMDIGSEESAAEEMEPHQLAVYRALTEAGWKADREVVFKRIPGAKHDENSWSKRFHKVIKYLYR
ncbi:MAG: alpha/beta hydrolase [Candidatus Marinimicrobia bacterium]|nr:alpha/beta hydrolase [Candidatus Neomarinimicrobiota bacterium]